MDEWRLLVHEPVHKPSCHSYGRPRSSFMYRWDCCTIVLSNDTEPHFIAVARTAEMAQCCNKADLLHGGQAHSKGSAPGGVAKVVRNDQLLSLAMRFSISVIVELGSEARPTTLC